MKDRFIFIDGGGNSDRFGMWSDPTRDWEKIFWDGLKPPKQMKEQLDDINECSECGWLKPKAEKECPNCGYIEEPPTVIDNEPEIVNDKRTAKIKKIVYPNGEKIVNYCLSIKEDVNFAFKILINQVFDMFVKHEVTAGTYQKSKNDGSLEERLNKILGYPFVKIIQSDLPSKSNRTLNYLKVKLKTRLDEKYNKI